VIHPLTDTLFQFFHRGVFLLRSVRTYTVYAQALELVLYQSLLLIPIPRTLLDPLWKPVCLARSTFGL
jgi:hypothetical protein